MLLIYQRERNDPSRDFTYCIESIRRISIEHMLFLCVRREKQYARRNNGRCYHSENELCLPTRLHQCPSRTVT
jgi:hypothetical protein